MQDTLGDNNCHHAHNCHDRGKYENDNHVVHVRLNMTYLGLRVIGGDSVIHVAKKRDVTSITKTIQNPIAATLADVDRARNVLGNPSNTELVFYSDILSTPLCTDTTITGIAQDRTPMVVHSIRECATQKLLRNFTDTKTFKKTGWPFSDLQRWDEYNSTKVVYVPCSNNERFNATGHTMYSGKVNLSVSLTAGHYVLDDTDRLCHYTVSSTDLVFADNKDHDRVQTLDETTFGDGTVSDEHTASADAHYGHAAAYDFFSDVFARKGVFNNTNRTYSRVHVGKKYSNAFWHKEEMSYGDGDGIYTRPCVSLDAAAHVFTHGVIENSANLEYAGESGALSEATADIMSVLIDYYAVDRGFRDPNYLIGEDINFHPGTFERSLVQPSSDKVNYEANGGKDALGNPEGSYDCYCQGIGNVDVHMSSGVANHFFYLLAEGTEEGAGGPSKICGERECQNATLTANLRPLGRAEAGKIWYMALTRYFVSHTNYALARDATMLAASDLFSHEEWWKKEAVSDAWDAVNVKKIKTM